VQRQIGNVQTQGQQLRWLRFLPGRLSLEVAAANPGRDANGDASGAPAPQRTRLFERVGDSPAGTRRTTVATGGRSAVDVDDGHG